MGNPVRGGTSPLGPAIPRAHRHPFHRCRTRRPTSDPRADRRSERRVSQRVAPTKSEEDDVSDHDPGRDWFHTAVGDLSVRVARWKASTGDHQAARTLFTLALYCAGQAGDLREATTADRHDPATSRQDHTGRSAVTHHHLHIGPSILPRRNTQPLTLAEAMCHAPGHRQRGGVPIATEEALWLTRLRSSRSWTARSCSRASLVDQRPCSASRPTAIATTSRRSSCGCGISTTYRSRRPHFLTTEKAGWPFIVKSK